MKKTIFSKGLYKESLRRLSVIGFLSLAAMLIVQFIPVIGQATEYSYYLNNRNIYGSYTFEPMALNFETVFMSFWFMTVLAAPIMVIMLFSVFNKRASSDFYHALPYTRPCIFVSQLAAVYTWVIGVGAACSVIGLVTYVSLPHLFVLSWGSGFDLLISYFAILLITTGGVALAMAITGTPFSNVCVAGVILFLPRIIIMMLALFISDRAGFLVFNYNTSSFLSPFINVLFASVSGGTKLINNPVADIYSICLGIVYLALALFVFVKRKSETATQPALSKLWQHIIRITITVAFALIPVIFLVEGTFAAFIVFSLITVLVYFTYEIISTKKWKNCLKAAPGLLVVAGICVVFVLTIVFVPVISAKYTPDAEDIDSVQLLKKDSMGYYDSYYGGNWYGIEAEKLKITDEKVLEIVSDALKKNMESFEKHGDIYYRDDGKYSSYVSNATGQTVAIREGLSVHYRYIVFTEEEYSSLLAALQKDEDYKKAVQTLPKPAKGSLSVDFFNGDGVTEKDLEKVLDTLQKEMYALSLEEFYGVAHNYSSTPGSFNLWYYTDDFSSTYVDIYIDSYSFPKTFEMLLDMSSKNNDKAVEELSDILDPEFHEENTVWYSNVEAHLKITTKDGEARYYYLYTYRSEYDETDKAVEEAIADVFELAKNTKSDAVAERYIVFNYSCDFGKGENEDDFKEYSESYYGTVYLPLPENFDPELYGFEPIEIYDDANDVEEYVDVEL